MYVPITSRAVAASPQAGGATERPEAPPGLGEEPPSELHGFLYAGQMVNTGTPNIAPAFLPPTTP
eukprot:CAMPEP_0174915408 /NCGR_PEP_ID=MMETSP1355-20121228/1050_1 /TAXON_ID=464990 /ORGANISM="Hemiselmis tepida, Strain CCMP443" /LENGTH=64 /DNA_ID=CAMNT_0016160287 /DNA_START=81 /DNA_END=272 /DNA_ORIENTATION=-